MRQCSAQSAMIYVCQKLGSIHCVRFAFERFFSQSSPFWWFHAIFMIRLMEEILHKLRLVVYPIIYRVLYIQTVVGLGISEPSAVVWDDTFTEFFDLSFWLLRSKGGATSTFCGHKVEVGGRWVLQDTTVLPGRWCFWMSQNWGLGFLLSKFSDHFDRIVAGKSTFFEPRFRSKKIVFKKRENLDGFQVWYSEPIFKNWILSFHICLWRHKQVNHVLEIPYMWHTKGASKYGVHQGNGGIPGF